MVSSAFFIFIFIAFIPSSLRALVVKKKSWCIINIIDMLNYGNEPKKEISLSEL